jgi:hypothetical protein
LFWIYPSNLHNQFIDLATSRGEKQQAGGKSNKQGGEAISRGEKQQAGGSTSNKQGGAEATRGSKSNKKEGAKYIPIPHY